MRAVAKTKGERGVTIIDTDPDTILEDEVLLKMMSASICGSDLGIYDFSPAYQKFTKIPIILGHEFSGQIVGVGNHVTDYYVGDRVVCESIIYCGECASCRAGMTNICRNFKVFGVHRNGGFAEYVSVPARYLHKIPSGVSFADAGITEPLSIVINALDEVARVRLGETAAVVGPGPIGLMAAELLALKGMSRTFVLGVSADSFRLRLAEAKLGCTAINVQSENANEIIMGATKGDGCRLVVVATGASEGLRSAIQLVSKGGQLVILGIFSEDVAIPITDLVRGQVAFLGSYASRWVHYETALSLLKDRRVGADAIVTHRFKLDSAEEAFEVARSRAGGKVQFYS